jgi:sugar transferase (PEP-CTERM/EpsH1 system associated)
MRVLVITSDIPFPPRWGAAIRNFQFLKGLAPKHDVVLLTFRNGDVSAAVCSLEQLGIAVRTVPWHRPKAKRLSQLKSIASSRSHLGAMFHQQAMQAEIDLLLGDARFDVVLMEGSLLSRLRLPPDVPLVLDEHNIEFEILQRTYRTERSPLRKLFSFAEYHKFRSEEHAAWRRAATVVFTSAREGELMSSYGFSTPWAVVPNGVDLEYLTPSESRGAPNRIVFTGRIGYRPNLDAVLHFAREILPIVHRRRPDVVFTIVGAEIPRSVRRLASPRIEVVGPVEDMRPYWQQAAVAVVPIRFGGGTRLKVVEAMAMGKAVVSSSVGCEGILLEPGEHLLVADSPDDFAGAVLRLLDDPELRDDLGRRARQLVETEYGWPRLAASLDRVLELSVAGSSVRG